MTVTFDGKEYLFNGFVYPLNSINELVNDVYNKSRADAIEEFEPLLKLLVDMESESICCEMSPEYCEEHCRYDCPQKECYLEYLKQLKEQNNGKDI